MMPDLQRRRRFVLVADDDRDTRELYRACFDTSGYRTAEAATGSQALVAALEIVPDVLLTDLVLPDVDGVTVARRLKCDLRTAGIHVFVVTGYATADLESRASEAGVERVLLKPCLPHAVLREVKLALGRPARAPLRMRLNVGRPAEPAGGERRPVERERRDVRTRAAVASRIRAEFGSLPGLLLTPEQARLVFEVERAAVERILNALVEEGFLARTAEGTFLRPRDRRVASASSGHP
ncbi:MAG TPA: response regulator [Vicinamibacterales bacterium]|nr:response regulator [Vicinamibacterales bacterium]